MPMAWNCRVQFLALTAALLLDRNDLFTNLTKNTLTSSQQFNCQQSSSATTTVNNTLASISFNNTYDWAGIYIQPLVHNYNFNYTLLFSEWSLKKCSFGIMQLQYAFVHTLRTSPSLTSRFRMLPLARIASCSTVLSSAPRHPILSSVVCQARTISAALRTR